MAAFPGVIHPYSNFRFVANLFRRAKPTLSMIIIDINDGLSNDWLIFLRWYWDLLMTLILIAALVAQPLQIAFYSTNDEGENLGVVIASSIVALIFIIDILINFRTGIDDSHSDVVILEKAAIARLLHQLMN